MDLSLSIELEIPASVNIASVIALGRRCYPYDIDEEEMDIGEAVQWCFSEPKGIAALSAMGITWALCQNGTVLIHNTRGSQIA
jgi:hypothetical protein